jgi:hypothetical protein
VIKFIPKVILVIESLSGFHCTRNKNKTEIVSDSYNGKK